MSVDVRRPRLLYVVRVVPYVPSTGGVTRTYHLVRAAAEVADVTLVGASENPTTARVDAMRPFCARIILVPTPPPIVDPVPSRSAPLARATDIARALTRTDPYLPGQYDAAALRAAVREVLQAERYDIAVVEYTHIAALLRDVIAGWNGVSMADMHNVDSVYEQRRQRALLQQANRRRPSLSGWRSVHQLRTFERGILQTYTRVTAVSASDAACLRRLAPTGKVNVVPNGVDVDYFGAVEGWQRDDALVKSGVETLLFTGTLWYQPNIDALHFFVDNVWPLVRARRPNVRFLIVGGDPVPEVWAMAAREGIDVFASVPDIRPYLAVSNVVVVPLRLGSGTRLKILEALAAHRPVVSTTLGAEGLDLEPGSDLLLADTPMAFANAVVTLLERQDEARELAAHGQETVHRLYSWDIVGATFQRLLRELVAHAMVGVGSRA